MCHHIGLIFKFLVEMGSHYVAQAIPELLASVFWEAKASGSPELLGRPKQENGLNPGGPEMAPFHSSLGSKRKTLSKNRTRTLKGLYRKNGIWLYHPSWSAVVQSWLTATSASHVQVILPPQSPESLGLQRQGFTMLPRLVLNSWTHTTLLPWGPKVLGLQITLGGRGGWITRGQEFETNLANMIKSINCLIIQKHSQLAKVPPKKPIVFSTITQRSTTAS
ncbi:hypothetical protein AAY473_000617 [Plecturocebus cupreus]